MEPVVSVIIPNYNHASFLKQRIDSVLFQTFQNFEVIILDDCSTDASRAVIELYRGNPKIKHIVYNDTNSGSPFKQWQKGIELASGKFIWIAESDDFCKDIFLQTAVKALDRTGHAVHYCQSYIVDENSNIINDNFSWTESIRSINWHQSFSMTGKDFVRKALQFQNVIPNASAVVFKKKAFDFSQLKKYTTAGDWLFWIRILMFTDISYSSEILNNFRSHSNTTRSTTTHKKFILRHFEILAIKHDLCYTYGVTSNKDVDKFLEICIGICSIYDTVTFIKFCKKFKLPHRYIYQFLKRKLRNKSLFIAARGKNFLSVS